MDEAGVIETSFNLFDVAVLSIIGLSALLSFFRGFVREVLSLGAWVGASIITLYAFPDVAATLKPYVNSSVIASGLAAMGTFMLTLVVISIFNAMLMRLFKKGNEVGVLDNLLGLGFGVLRAGLLVSLGYYVVTIVIPENNYPEWLATSKTRPYVEKGAILIDKLAPGYLEELSPLGDDSDDGVKLDPNEDIDSIGKKHNDDNNNADSGYEWMNVEELERLIDSSQDNINDE